MTVLSLLLSSTEQFKQIVSKLDQKGKNRAFHAALNGLQTEIKL